MNALIDSSEIDLNLVHSIIVGTLLSASIFWWIWIVYASLEQLQKNQISLFELFVECFRSLMVILIALAITTFL